MIKNNHVLLLRDMNNSWTFPKGLVEDKEAFQQAAVREIAEEVGLAQIEFIAPLGTIEYTYRRARRIHKIVHYFLFRATAHEEIVCQKSEGIREAKWYDFNEALSLIGYRQTNVPLLEKVIKHL